MVIIPCAKPTPVKLHHLQKFPGPGHLELLHQIYSVGTKCSCARMEFENSSTAHQRHYARYTVCWHTTMTGVSKGRQ